MKTSYILMIITILAKVFGLVREQTLAYFFGRGELADVFLVAFSLPMMITNVISGAVANGYIPMFNSIKAKSGQEKANEFTANLSNILAIIFLIISIVAIIFASPLVKLMAQGFTGSKLNTAILVTRIALLSVSATAVFSIYKAYLQIHDRFVVSVIHAIIMNLIIILFLAITYKFGIKFLGIGILLAFTFQYIIFIPYVKKTSYKHKWIIDFKNEDIKKLLRIILPILISSSAIEINFMISKSLASELSHGGISILNYAYKLQSFVTGIVVTSIITAVYPQMAKYGSLKDFKGLRISTRDALSTMSILVIPATFGLFTFALPIVELLFMRGRLNLDDATSIANVLRYYAFGVFAIGIREILSRIYYSLDDTKRPVINSLVIVGVNIILSFVLAKFMGIVGLGLATTISFVVGGGFFAISSTKLIGKIFDKNLLLNLGKILLASLIMAAGSNLVFNILKLKLGSNLSLLLAIIFAACIYGIMLIILRVKEIKILLKKFNK